MAKTFVVAYDVTKAESDDYNRIDEALKPFGKIVEQGSVRWISESSTTAAQIKDAVVQAARRSSINVWVAEAGSDRAFHPSPK